MIDLSFIFQNVEYFGAVIVVLIGIFFVYGFMGKMDANAGRHCETNYLGLLIGIAAIVYMAAYFSTLQ